LQVEPIHSFLRYRLIPLKADRPGRPSEMQIKWRKLRPDTPAASAIGAKLFVMDLLCWDAPKRHKEDRCSLAM
jgi:hypothetical protein